MVAHSEGIAPWRLKSSVQPHGRTVGFSEADPPSTFLWIIQIEALPLCLAYSDWSGGQGVSLHFPTQGRASYI